MKLLILLGVVLGAVFNALAQPVSNSGYPKINLFNNPGITITLEVVDKVKYKYIVDIEETEQAGDTTFVVIDNDYGTFVRGFSMAAKSRPIKRKVTVGEAVLKDETNRVYYFFKAAEILAPNLDYRPVAGKLQISNELFIERNTAPDYMTRVMARDSVKRLTKSLDEQKTANNQSTTSTAKANIADKQTARLYRHYYFLFLKEKIYQSDGSQFTKQELKRKLQKDFADREAKSERERVDNNERKDFLEIIDSIEAHNLKRKTSMAELATLQNEIESLRKVYEGKDSVLKRVEQAYKRSEDEIKQLLSPDGESPRGSPKNPPDLLNTANYFFAYNQFRTHVRTQLQALETIQTKVSREVKALRQSLAQESNVLKKDSISDKIDLMLDSGNRISENVSNYRLVYDDKLPKLKAIVEQTIDMRKTFAPIKTKWTALQKREKEINAKIEGEFAAAHNEIKKKQPALFEKLVKAFENVRKVKYKVNQLEIEFNSGFIENVLVTGEVNDKVRYYLTPDQWVDSALVSNRSFVKFENRYPIGFSRKRDYENVSQKSLFTIERNLPMYRLRLENLIRAYVQQHEVNRRDYSPADTMLRVAFDSPITNRHSHTLYKDPTYRLFEARIFSDFVGLDRTTPNGLVQTEIDKNISLITNRFPRKVFKYEMWNFGFLSSITPTLTLSKIEENNRRLPLQYQDEVINGVYNPTRYSSTLELKRHENFSVGFDLNLVLLDIPTFKSTFFLDYGFRYGRVAIVDSLRDYNFATQEATLNKQVREYGVNTMQFYPRINWLIKTDERYSFNFSGSVNWYFLRSNEFEQVANEEVFADSQEDGGATRRVFANVSMLATLRPSPQSKGKLFFRYQYNWQWNYANTGFHQAQVGYSFYLLSNRK